MVREERDYLLRMIHRFAQAMRAVLAQVLKLRQEKQPALALEQLAEAYRGVFGFDPRYLALMDASAIRAALGDPQRVAGLAELFLAEAGLREDLGEHARAKLLLQRAGELTAGT